jgi:transcriptional regulator with XRE-family HTH domain
MTNTELKEIRVSMGINQKTMALLIGMEDQGNYSRLETGARQPTKQQTRFVRTIKLIADHGLLDRLLAMAKK